MRQIGNYEFPETPSENKSWKPSFAVRALHSKVLIVAKTRIEGKWASYCTPVPGQSHADEMALWKTEGAKMPEQYARPMFPEFDLIPYAK